MLCPFYKATQATETAKAAPGHAQVHIDRLFRPLSSHTLALAEFSGGHFSIEIGRLVSWHAERLPVVASEVFRQ